MPTYTYRDKNTNEEQVIFMSISERDRFVTENPHLQQLVTGAPMIIDPIRLGVTKRSGALEDKLKSVKRWYKNTNIDTK